MTPTLNAEGYLHEQYAQALAEFGYPRKLNRSGAWILERPIPGSAYNDGMGCYPLFCCQNWSALASDMQELRDLVSLVVVTDPFSTQEVSELSRCFPDLTKPFKRHFITDLAQDPNEFLSHHHKRNIEKSLAIVKVERCDFPMLYADQWVSLYQQLISKHSISGISAFSPESLTKQLAVPGLEMFRGIVANETVGIVLWLVQGNVAYYHLAAYNDVGYETCASFAIFQIALQAFAQRGLQWLGLGSSAGLKEDETDGLARFKSGWSTGTKIAYLCGRILNVEAYSQLVRNRDAGTDDYFPPYRKG